MLLAMFVASAGALVTSRRVPRPARADSAAPQRISFTALMCGLVVTFVAHLATIVRASREQLPYPVYLHALPLVPILDRAPLFGHTSAAASTAAWSFALLETLELIGLALLLRGRSLRAADYLIVAVGSLALVCAALATSGLTSGDIYAYVGYSRLGMSAYRPPALAFGGQFAQVNALWGVPLLPCAYGPLWLAFVHSALAPFPTLAAQILVLRAIGACSFIAIIVGVVALRPAPLVVVLVALDPALVEQFVADAHNDGIPIALTLAAAACARRWPGAAVACAVAATLVKLPFVAIAALAFAREPRVRRRLAYAAASVTAGVIASLAFGGSPYMRALASTAKAYGSGADVLDGIHVAVAASTVGAIALAITCRRFGWQAAWSFAGFGRALFPWYFGWGLPYAVLAGPTAWIYLASLPLVMNLTTTSFSGVPARTISLVGLMFFATFAVRNGFRERRHSVRTPRAGSVAVAAPGP